MRLSPDKAVPILIIGTGGHARVVASIIDRMNKYNPIGLLDLENPNLGEPIGGSRVIGGIEDLPKWRRECRHAALAIGDNRLRCDWASRLENMGFQLPFLVHPTALLEHQVDIGHGTVVCAGVIICGNTTIGPYSIINTGAQVDHECRLARGVHLGPGTLIAGRICVDEGAFIGIGTVIKDNIKIGAWSVIGAGSLVLRDIPAMVTAYGRPARIADR